MSDQNVYMARKKNCEFAGECVKDSYPCELLHRECKMFGFPDKYQCYPYIMFKKAEGYGH